MYIVTDLTRFSPGNPNVCTALIDIANGHCIRPLPYFSYDFVKRNGILPGATFSGKFTTKDGLVAPHLEDCNYTGLKHNGPATSAQFRQVLLDSMSSSVVQGFEHPLKDGEKLLPMTHRGRRSIITISVDPQSVSIQQDQYNENKIKLSFTDSDGRNFRYMPITDLGFYDYAYKHHDAGDLAQLNIKLARSREIILRVGLSREYKSPDGRSGYWIQINGIYTFPAKPDFVRGYD